MADNPANIGRYQVVRAIGQGGMGALYLAWDPKLERQIAIKLLRGDDDELRERFAREARSVARLRHPNIVMIYDVGDHEGQPFIAMEFIQGQTLSEVIRQRTMLPTLRKVELMAELCDGLGFAHKSGVIHRDIKPANVMVDHEGLLKILDFGIARLAESAGMTQAGMLIGTLNYMSPEQVTGQPVDSRSDIFAVGALFYELLAYRQAFPGGLETGILHKIISGQPEPLDKIARNLDEDVIRIVDRCIEKEPGKRYQDLASMRKDLMTVRARLESTTVAATQVIDLSHDVTQTGTAPGPTPTPPRRTTDREELARRRTTQITAYLDQGQQAFASGDLESAIALCEQVLLLDADDARALDLLDRARAGLDQRQLKELLTAAEHGLQQGSLTAARELIDKAAALDPASARVTELRQVLDDAVRERERARQRAESIRQAMSRAQTLLASGSFVESASAADEALAIDPNFSDASALKTRALEAQRTREREAEERARRERIAAGVQAARVKVDAHQFNDALDDLRALTATEGSTPEIAGLAREAEGGLAAAERAARRAEEVAKATAQASDLFAKHDLSSALARANAALALQADHEPARELRDKIQTAIRVETERREAEARAAAERRREEERIAAEKREAEERAARERREAEERAARERQQAIALALKKAKQASTTDAAIAAAREVLALDPQHGEAQKLLKAREAAHEREQAEARRVQAIDRARHAIEEQVSRGELDSAERALKNAEQELNAKSTFKPLRQQLNLARSQEAAERAAREKAAAPKPSDVREDSTTPVPGRAATEPAAETVSAAGGQNLLADRRVVYGGAAALVVLGLAGYLLFGRGTKPSPPASDVPAKVAAAAPQPPQSPSPAPQPVQTPAATPPVATPGGSTTAAPPAAAPATPTPDPTDLKVAAAVRNARQQLARGDHDRALALAKNALALKADDPDVHKLLNEMLQSARNGRDQARTSADAAGQNASDSTNYADAVARDQEAERAARDGHPERAIPLVREAAQGYTRAAAEPRKPAPTPPAAAPPARPAAPTAPPVAATPPPTPTPAPNPPVTKSAPAAPSAAEEENAIRAVVNYYAQAYNELNVSSVQRVFPTVRAKELGESFALLSRQQVEIKDEKVDIRGSNATVECQWSVTYKPRAGKENKESHKVKLQLQKNPTGWIIVNRS